MGRRGGRQDRGARLRRCRRGPGDRRAARGHVRCTPRLGRDGGCGRRDRDGATVSYVSDPITLSVFVSALTGIAEEMGVVLVRSSYSSNIKERRDCSCALFDRHGRMVAQAEHIPVHLGAMPDAVAAVLTHDPAPGEIWVLNDPYTGGTHLPDITLVSRTEVGFAVTRAHHADARGR